MAALLSMNMARVNFGALAAVDDVTLDLGEGEVCGIVGPNGSGKTTLLNAVSGALEPTSGSIVYKGVETAGQPAHVSARLGLRRTFQLLRLLVGQSVLENVLAGLQVGAPDTSFSGALNLGRESRRYREHAMERAVETMEQLGIEKYARDHVESLPFGIQRRVELGRAIVSRPDLLLLDEPASGLDDDGVADLGSIIDSQRSAGTAVVLVDHHLEFVLEVCPRVVVMNYGRVIFDGSGRNAVANADVRRAYIGD